MNYDELKDSTLLGIQWEAVRVDDGWQFRNVANGRYLAVDADGGDWRDDLDAKGSDDPFTWHVWPTDDGSAVRLESL